MDPGYKLLQHIKTVPNLINEDPSITTPKNSSFMDLPWSDLSKLLNTNKRRPSASGSTTSESSSSAVETPENFSLGNWDSMTGYQDSEHRNTFTMFLPRTNRPIQAQEVDTEMLDDPVLLFESMIANEQNMNDSIFLKILQQHLVKYRNDNRYMNTPHYLRLWFMYILYLNNTPLILPILYNLIDNHIGDKLSMLYEAVAYYQLKQNNIEEAEATLLLGLKNKARPIKRLKRVLDQFHLNRIIVFDINQFKLFNNGDGLNLNTPKTPSFLSDLKRQVDSIDAEIQQSLQRRNNISVKEQTNNISPNRHPIQNDENLISLRKDMDQVYNAFRKRKLINKNIHITSPTTAVAEPSPEPTQSLPEPPPSLAPSLPPSPQAEQVVAELELVKPTIPKEQESSYVVQLPHKSGFIRNQISRQGLLEHDGYHVIKDTSAQSIQKKLRAWFPTTTSSNHHQKQLRLIQLDKDDEYHVVKKLGQGGMAHVYLVQNTNNLSFYGLKVQQPPHPWEFYILNQLHQRRKESSHYLHAIPVFDFYHYADTSFLLLTYLQYGTLLNALNLYRLHQNQPNMPEPIVLLFTLQLLKEITALHRIHITHNDLKLDNIMLAVKTKKKKTPKLPTVVMIDFGHSIDLSLLKQGALVKANWPPACPASDYPLSNKGYHPMYADYWQLATMVYLLLFGVPMQYSIRDEKYSIRQTIKRYWHRSLWLQFFDAMLNPPCTRFDLHDLIQEFENQSHDVSDKLIQTFLDLLAK